MDAWQVQALGRWLLAHGLVRSAAIEVQVLAGGQSNPTFRIRDGQADCVLRKKPAGDLLPSAHAIDREYRVMQQLAGSAVPVPRMLAWCEDTSLLGTPFYVMEFLDGRVLSDQSLPGWQPRERAALYAEMNRVIAALHGVDPVAAGLADFGRPGHYVARQVARWTKQIEASTLAPPPALRRLMDWLPLHLPPEADSRLVHGDYRLDNLVFHPSEPRVLGVLDWELSTLGDPVADFAYHCMSWRIPAALWRGIGGLDGPALGLPEEAAYVRQYETTTGRGVAGHWEFYMAFNLFRMAAILHGIAQRAQDGTASAPDAAETGRKAEPLAELGWVCALRHAAQVS